MYAANLEIAKKMAEYERRKALPVKARYPIATTGAKTRDGGVVTLGSSGIVIDDNNAARVGDEVVYPDGSKASITSGAGYAMTDRGKPLAIIGSTLSNGDVVTESPSESFVITEFEGAPPIPGLLDPSYVYSVDTD